MSVTTPRRAMLLSAGLGLRMRPITLTMPKPLVEVGGRALIDWPLEALREAGVERVVVNVHHLPDQMIRHLDRRGSFVAISDERDRLLESGGGVVKALPLLGDEPFFVLNADSFWTETGERNLPRLARAWDGDRMDMLLMLADLRIATGHGTKTDFDADADGRLSRAIDRSKGHVYAGAAIVHPRIFEGAAAEPHSLNVYFDRAIAAGRLFGLPMKGHWFTVGTPDAIGEAERELERLGQPVS